MITSVSSDSPDSTPPTDLGQQDREKIGCLTLLGFSAIAAIGMGWAVPAITGKKKRIYSLLSPVPIEVAPEPEAPEHPMVPHCTPEEREKVAKIFTTMAKGGLAIIAATFRLIQWGKEIDHIHPFSFLLAAPKESARKILETGSSFAKTRLMEGVTKGMNREVKNLQPYVSSFATEMGKSPEQVRSLVQSRDWGGAYPLPI